MSDDESIDYNVFNPPSVPKFIPCYESRACVRRNYIPHRPKKHINRYEWQNAYINELIIMYNLTESIITKNYPKVKIVWESNKLFNEFSSLIYHCSSKHISEYLFEFKDKDYTEKNASREEK